MSAIASAAAAMPDADMPRGRILVGDARQVLATLPASSVDCVITSPPYFRLRNYQHPEQLGLEAHVDGWVDELRLVARSLARVLKPTGSLWLNLGDTYSPHTRHGAAAKSLLLAPERVALALSADGWTLRNKVIWAKPNPMPTSVRDRLSCTYEVVYFFTRSGHYFFDLDAIRVPHMTAGRKTKQRTARSDRPAWSVPLDWRGPASGSHGGLDRLKASGLAGHPLGKNPGDVWTIPTAGFRGAHYAVYPEALVRTPLLATCPERACRACGTPWRRKPNCSVKHLTVLGALWPDCRCRAGSRPGLVLDPFMGSGTTAVVAQRLGREWLGIEVSPRLAAAAERRIAMARSPAGRKPAPPTSEPRERGITHLTNTERRCHA